ncbi:MAG TPA: hypothetical protein VI542_10020 [Candidatus Tectomicrobia bacterium]
MSPMYVDTYAILDVRYPVTACLIDGRGEDDGQYVIGCMLAIGDVVEHVALVYPTAQTRDAAFVAIGQCVTAWEAQRAAQEDEA